MYLLLFRIIDLIESLDESIVEPKIGEIKTHKMNKETTFGYVQKFFDQYLPQKALEAKSILNQTHPLFVDPDGKSHINFFQKPQSQESKVGIHGNNPFLEFQVSLDGTIENDGILTAHEITHALSSRLQNMAKSARENKEMPHLHDDEFFNNNCTTEIEAYVTERLFVHFLEKEKLFSKQDAKNYLALDHKSLISETTQVMEEAKILEKLSCPITENSLKTLVKQLRKKGDKRLLGRIQEMHNDPRLGDYKFKYIVGRVVGDTFIKEFEKAPESKKAQMLNRFQDYLDGTHNQTLDGACQKLLGKDFSFVCKDFIKKQRFEKLKVKGKSAITRPFRMVESVLAPQR